MRRRGEKAFESAVQAMIDECTQLGWPPNYFVRMCGQMGMLSAARKVLNKPRTSPMFKKLHERGRLDLTLEAIALKFPDPFKRTELAIYKERLTRAGWNP